MSKDCPKLAIGFFPRDKYSHAPLSLGVLIKQVPPDAKLLIFDNGYPPEIIKDLRQILMATNIEFKIFTIPFNSPLNRMVNKFILLTRDSCAIHMFIENDVIIQDGVVQECINALNSGKGDIIVPKVIEMDGTVHFNPSVSIIVERQDGTIRSFLDRGRMDLYPIIYGRTLMHLERHCFFFGKKATNRIGIFDENMFCRTDFDTSFSAFKANLTIYMPENATVIFNSSINPDIDGNIYVYRWDKKRVKISHDRLINKFKLYKFKETIEHVDEALQLMEESRKTNVK